MPAAIPVTTVTEPSRFAARDGGAQSIGAGFIDLLAQALAAPAPGSDAPLVPGPQPAAAQGEPAPAGAMPEIDRLPTLPAPATPAPVTATAAAVPQPPVAADRPEAVAAIEPGESEAENTVSEPDEPAAEPAQNETPTGDPAPAPVLPPPPALAAAAVPLPAAANAIPDAARSDAASPLTLQADAPSGAGSRTAAGDVAQQAAAEFASEEPPGNEPAARPPTAQRKPAALAPSAAVPSMVRRAPMDDAPAEALETVSSATPAAQVMDAAPAPKADEVTTPAARDLSLPDPGPSIAGAVQTASPHVAPHPAPGTGEVAPLAVVQVNAPAHSARPDAAPTAAAPSSPAPPAAQVAPAVAALVSTAANGAQRLVVRLDPVELGQVEVRVERTEGGPAAVALTVERPETLLLLVRDQVGLHRALDQAGVPAEGRTLQFQLGQPAPGAPGQQLDAGAGGGWGGGGARHGRGETSRGWRHLGDGDTQTVRTAWSSAGIDITA